MTTQPSHLPPWRHVLAVVAHPDDESFALGAVIAALADSGSRVDVVCLTRGEASLLGADHADLAGTRAAELRCAAALLGVNRVTLADFPDGGLRAVDPRLLDEAVAGAMADGTPDLMLAFDPTAGVTGHLDHEATSRAAARVARAHGLSVLGWAVPRAVAQTLNGEFGTAFHGYDVRDLDLVLSVDRARQSEAIACHASQAVPGRVLWRRLELLQDSEYLRWVS